MCSTTRKSVRILLILFIIQFNVLVSSYDVASALLVENGNFSWGDEETVLKDINMRVEKGELTAVVGTVGSGKC